MLQAVNRPLLLDNTEIALTCSIGVSLYPDDNADPDTLLRHADKAMYQAKEAGRNRIQWFDPAHEREAQEHRMMLEQLDDALTLQQFMLYYQPKVNLRSGVVVGMEALIRWQHPERGLLAPAAFLPLLKAVNWKAVLAILCYRLALPRPQPGCHKGSGSKWGLISAPAIY